MRFVIGLLCLVLCGCSTPVAREAFAPAGHLLFSIHLVKGAFSGVEEQTTGCYFYIEDPEPNIAGPTITGYVVSKGYVTETIRAGSYESVALREEIEKIGFEQFDLESEVKRIDAERTEEARRTGTMISGVTSLDGAEYEIRFVYAGVDYTLLKWNPGTAIDFYADYSPKVRKLKQLVDAFARYYGRRKFDI